VSRDLRLQVNRTLILFCPVQYFYAGTKSRAPAAPEIGAASALGIGGCELADTQPYFLPTPPHTSRASEDGKR